MPTKKTKVSGVAMLAPCGMNCALCLGQQREKKRCPGCHGADRAKPWHCVNCAILNCAERKGRKQQFCFVCAKFPCRRLQRLDKRYRTKYGMSMIANLEDIRELGRRVFAAREKEKWRCPHCGGMLCVHRPDCLHCGQVKSQPPAG